MRPRLTAAATLIAAGLLLSACGGGPLDDKAGPEVAAAAADALEAAGAFHLSGTISRGGQAGQIDLQLQGDDASGTLTLEGSEIQLITVGGSTYVQAPLPFWTSFGIPDGSAAAFEGQWVALPDESAAEFATFSVAGFVGELRQPDGGLEEEVSGTEIDGEDAVVAVLKGGGTLTVLNDDPSYPVEVTNDEGSSSGTVTISGFGDEETITAPSNATDLAELVGS
jgi:hypothetical protein